MLANATSPQFLFFLMIGRPPRSTRVRSSAASDVYKRQVQWHAVNRPAVLFRRLYRLRGHDHLPVSYTHLRAHETPEHLVCRFLLEKKKTLTSMTYHNRQTGKMEKVADNGSNKM